MVTVVANFRTRLVFICMKINLPAIQLLNLSIFSSSSSEAFVFLCMSEKNKSYSSLISRMWATIIHPQFSKQSGKEALGTHHNSSSCQLIRFHYPSRIKRFRLFFLITFNSICYELMIIFSGVEKEDNFIKLLS